MTLPQLTIWKPTNANTRTTTYVARGPNRTFGFCLRTARTGFDILDGCEGCEPTRDRARSGRAVRQGSDEGRFRGARGRTTASDPIFCSRIELAAGNGSTHRYKL